MEVTGLRLGALTAGRLTHGRPVRLRTADAENLRKHRAARPGGVERRIERAGDHIARRRSGLLPRSAGRDLMVDGLWAAVPDDSAGTPGAETRGDAWQVPDWSTPLRLRRRPAESLGAAPADGTEPVRRGTRPPDRREPQPSRGQTRRGTRARRPPALSSAQPPRRRGRAWPGGASLGDQRAVDLMEEDPSEPWTTVRLAIEVHLSPRGAASGVPPGSGHAADGLPARGSAAPGARAERGGP